MQRTQRLRKMSVVSFLFLLSVVRRAVRDGSRESGVGRMYGTSPNSVGAGATGFNHGTNAGLIILYLLCASFSGIGKSSIIIIIRHIFQAA